MAKKKGSNSRSQADFYSQKAKREGYPARSVYKLEEIQQKFSLMKKGDTVLDIGAAPGSWTLYVHRKILKGSGRITAVDLKPITDSLSPLPETVTAFTGDAFNEENRKEILSLGPYDTVISDAAPSTTGNRSVDTLRSEGLVESILTLLPVMLKPEGNLVMKIFQGGGQQAILKQMRSMFKTTKNLKPKACRKDSFETFLIGLHFLGGSEK